MDLKMRLVNIIDNRWGYFDSGKLADDLISNGVKIIENGKWVVYADKDGYNHHRCNKCGIPALFYPDMEEDFDEDIDGGWVSLGNRQVGIIEFLTDYCPRCGSNMSDRK